MLISYDWLQELIQTNKPAAEVAALLTGSGLEVEGLYPYERVKGGLQGIVIGEVLTCEKHPDADKLRLTTVDVGTETPKQIVCGAPNVAAGQKVIVATEGATLYPFTGESFQIKKSKIRGAASEGMICAEDEIGLGESHAGIMVLDTDLPNGTPAAQYFNLQSDKVFEIGLTPNRADAASHLGVARDLQALLRVPYTLPNVDGFTINTNSRNILVEVQDSEACPRYAGLTISGVKVAESPEWLKHRLRAIDLSPINNVVDITNYVLHELGQPMHAFDADKIAGDKIIVKKAEEGIKFVTLDNVERTLRSTDLMICNAEEPMVIAGVFGGKNSGVTSDTTTIFLEAAYFQPASIRKSSQIHGIKTDSSFRFERGTDPNMVILALKRAALLVQEIAGGEVSSEIVDVYPQPVQPFTIKVSIARVNQLIGQEIGLERVKEILTDLGIGITEESETDLVLSVPPFKVDVQREADIVEEILRIYGYNNIALTPNLATSYLAKFPKPDPEVIKQSIGQLLAGAGYSEIITNSLTNSKYYESAGQEPDASLVRIVNYNSADLDVLRQTLVFSGLEVLRHNMNRRQKDLKLYELGKVYVKAGNKYQEKTQLALFVTGNATAETWQQPSQKVNFHQLAGVVQNLLTKLTREQLNVQPVEHRYIKNGIAYYRNDVPVVQMGMLNEAVTKKLDVKEPVWYAELNWDYLIRNYSDKLVAEELAKFPEVRRDLSLVVDKNITFEQIKAIAWRTERKLLQQLNVFDVYQGDKIDAGKKAYAMSFILQDKQQTLTDKVIDSTMNRLMQQFERQLGAVIRK
ncbi:phenylalanine--tRNA ligase subunit beta [Adhaeribacter radiodurans]|uniref:Phenylalanine--tRNA ligase beta subunit n=1 Tax=Adhaeribacter radiodurans TaxID=2745197 RepID=A0A7L7L3E3_9BACT|nr:phenylalanine--tRNA ligase subunit beta [Adhaeribacter radiodurans]QMU27318.1 phenylalanine--tRNA ligase subunit beta [Adhaeribacter radiodurans]